MPGRYGIVTALTPFLEFVASALMVFSEVTSTAISEKGFDI